MHHATMVPLRPFRENRHRASHRLPCMIGCGKNDARVSPNLVTGRVRFIFSWVACALVAAAAVAPHGARADWIVVSAGTGNPTAREQALIQALKTRLAEQGHVLIPASSVRFLGVPEGDARFRCRVRPGAARCGVRAPRPGGHFGDTAPGADRRPSRSPRGRPAFAAAGE